MKSVSLAAPARRGWSAPGWLPALLLLAGAAVFGPTLGSVSRPMFIVGCAAAGWYAWRQSPIAHLQAALALFTFAPLVRRLVDLAAGFDPTGVMLVGPLLAIMVPVPELRRLSERHHPLAPALAPMIVVGCCVTYATALSLFQGEWMNAASGSIKWIAPLLYAAALHERARTEPGLLQGAASVFLFILPVTGLYGIAQYVDPPAWDRYWMTYASITSAGLPEPYAVRTFSTLNGPASFATFTAAGLLMVCFLKSGWKPLLLAAPAALALLLSMYRTGWLSLAVGTLFCLPFAATRLGAALALSGILGVVALATALTPFGEVIGDRLATLGKVAEDDSAQERLDQLATLWHQPDSGLFGAGFTVTDAGSAGAMAIDGMIVSSWVTMGIVVGLVCLAALVWAAAAAMAAAWRDGSREAVVIGALAAGALAQLPLANIASGELGFLFWTFVALAPYGQRASRSALWTR